MSLLEVLLVGVGLSMDAFAVSVGKGLSMQRVDYRAAAALAVSFGLFQALMPVLGWLLASFFASAIEAVDHWVAFILLAVVGVKMIADSLGAAEDAAPAFAGIRLSELMLLSVATSIDAFAVGISFAALGVAPLPAVAIIGVTTLLFSLAGVLAGSLLGTRFERGAGVAGGVILIAIGLKVLVEHLGL